MTTPVNTTPTNQSIQQTQHEELDLQPSRGPREESIVNTIDQFLDENYEDVLHTSNIQTNFSLSASDRNVTGRPVLPLGWIIPDGTNRTLEEIKDKKISNDHSPGGGQAGAVVMTLQQLEPYFGTQFFLVDLETGEMFAYIWQQWRRTRLYCSSKLFVINDLIQDQLSLPPPVQTPKRKGNNSEDPEHFQNSRENVGQQNTVSKVERRNEKVTPAQGEPREFREHSRESLDPMESIRNLHVQQRQNRRSTQELNQTTPSAPQTTRIQANQEEANLITFSPVVEQQVPLVQGATGFQEQPK